MPLTIANLYAALPAFLLVLFRIGGLMLAAPLFGSPLLPTQLTALLAVAMSLAVFPLMVTHITVPVTVASAVGGLAGELAIGVLIGLGVTLVFTGVQMAAQLVSQQAGIALGEVFNPMLDAPAAEVSQLYTMVVLTVFLAVNGHHALVRAVMDSFATIPPLAFQPDAGLIDLLADMITLSMVIAVRVGGPIMLALLLAFLTLGFISRTVPQLNILTVGFPIKVAMALFLMAMTLMGLESILIDGITGAMDQLREGLGMPTR
ncbi:MAG: flagellar biosynthetic protein FliR [Phycisphaerae bacterium]|jgi:flagellar biosynthetic protein FliR